jgi:hypothetical protein
MKTMRHVFVCLWLAVHTVVALSAAGATNSVPSPNSAADHDGFSFEEVQAARVRCIEGRRMICGKIVRLLPDGMVVDSGYTNLMRRALESSWLIPGTVEARREPALVERREPDCPAVGLVYLTETPKSKRRKPQLNDFVVMEAFPAGMRHYNSVGDVRRTVRHFTGSLPLAVRSALHSTAILEK